MNFSIENEEISSHHNHVEDCMNTVVSNDLKEIITNKSPELLDFTSINDKPKLFRKNTWHPNRKNTSEFQKKLIFPQRSFDNNTKENSPKNLTINNNENENENENQQFVHEIIDEENKQILLINEEEDEDLEEYNPYLIPVDFNILEKHIKANKFGFEIEDFQEAHFSQENHENNDSNTENNIKNNDNTTTKEIKEIMSEIREKVEEKNESIKKKYIEECPCCGESLNKIKPSFCFSSDKLEFLGYSYPLFMKILKSLICMVAIPYVFLIFIPNMIFLFNECSPDYDEEADYRINKFLFCETGDVAIDLLIYYQIIDDRMLLDFLFSIYLGIFAICLRIYCLRYIKKHEKINSKSKYTIYIRNLPKNVKEKQIIEYFEKFDADKKHQCIFWEVKKKCPLDSINNFSQKPSKIHYIYNLYDYLHLSKSIACLIKRRRKCLAFLKIYSLNCQKTNAEKKENSIPFLSVCTLEKEEELKKIDKEILLAHKQKSDIFKSLQQNPEEFFQKRFTGQAFIEFEDDLFVKEISKIYYSVYDERKKNFKGEQIFIEEFIQKAPSPEEIMWENFGMPFSKKVLIRIIMLILEIGFISLCGLIIYLVYSNFEYEKFELEVLVGMLIFAINRILFWTIQKLVLMEKHKFSSFSEKRMIILSFSFFLVNMILYELFEYFDFVFDASILDIDENNYDEHEMEVFEVLIHKIYFVSVFLSLIEPILKFFFNYKYFIQLYRRYNVKKYPDHYSQEEAHEIFSGLEFELSEYFADFILIFSIGLLGAPFYPPSFLIVLAGLILQFWLFKINLLYRCKVEGELCKKLIPVFLKLINLSPLFYILGVYFNARKLLVGDYRSSYDFDGYFIVFLVEAIIIMIIARLNWDWLVYRGLKNIQINIEKEKEKGCEKTYNQLDFIFKHEKQN